MNALNGSCEDVAKSTAVLYRTWTSTPRVLIHTMKDHTCWRCVRAMYGERPPEMVAELETRGVRTARDVSMVQRIYEQCERVVIVSDLTVEGVEDALACMSCFTGRGEGPRLFWDAKTVERVLTAETLSKFGVACEPAEVDALMDGLRRLCGEGVSAAALGRIVETERTIHTEGLLCEPVLSQFRERMKELVEVLER